MPAATMPHALARPHYEVLNAKLAGATVACFLLVGRWSPERLLGIDSLRYYELNYRMLLEPRQWVLAILLLTILLLRFPRQRVLGRYEQETARFRRSAFRYLGLLFVYFIGSAAWAPDASFALLKGYETFLTLGVLVTIGLWHNSTAADLFLRSFWQVLFALTGLLVVLALYSLTTGRLAVLGGGPNVFARLMFLFAAASLGVSARFRILGLVFSVIGFALVALSGSRGGLLAAVVGGFAFLWMERARISSKLVVVMGGVATAAMVFVFTPLGRRVYDVFSYRILELTLQEGYTSDRDVLFEEAMEVWMQQPLLGTGISGWAALQWATAESMSSHPHNLFSEILSEGGVIAGCLLLLAMYKFFRYIQRTRDYVHIPSIASAAMFFAAAQFSGDFFDSRGIFICAMLATFPYVCRTPNIASIPAKTNRTKHTPSTRTTRPCKASISGNRAA